VHNLRTLLYLCAKILLDVLYPITSTAPQQSVLHLVSYSNLILKNCQATLPLILLHTHDNGQSHARTFTSGYRAFTNVLPTAWNDSTYHMCHSYHSPTLSLAILNKIPPQTINLPSSLSRSKPRRHLCPSARRQGRSPAYMYGMFTSRGGSHLVLHRRSTWVCLLSIRSTIGTQRYARALATGFFRLHLSTSSQHNL
jgi:hypothetical protein